MRKSNAEAVPMYSDNHTDLQEIIKEDQWWLEHVKIAIDNKPQNLSRAAYHAGLASERFAC